jgi:hypothetical protein
MKRLNAAFILFLILIAPCLVLAQEDFESEYVDNWIDSVTKELGGTQLRQIYRRYSSGDAFAAKEQLKLIAADNPIDEWEGLYYIDAPLTVANLHLSANLGYVNYSIYTCSVELRSLNYGRVKSLPEFIQLIPEFAENSPRTTLNSPKKLVKVKWGERHYLVDESSIKSFVEDAAGVWVANDDSNFIQFWIKKADAEKNIEGLPMLPESYKHLLRQPIETTIISVGKRRIEQERFDDGSIMSENSLVSVVINAGKEMNVKEGMRFYVSELDEWVEVTKVKQKTSLAVLKRMLHEGKEDCYDNEHKPMPCPKSLVGMSVITKYEERDL